MIAYLSRLMLYLTALLCAGSMTAVGLERLVGVDLMPLVYMRHDVLRVLQPGCASWWHVCEAVDDALLAGLDSATTTADWSPDGRVMALHGPHGYRMYDTACLLGRRADCALGRPLGDATTLRGSWGPDGSTFAYLTEYGRLLHVVPSRCWMSREDRCQTWVAPLERRDLIGMSWSAGGAVMALYSVYGELFLLDAGCIAAPETCAAQLRPAAVDVRWASLSSNGQTVVFEGEAPNRYRQIFRLDLTTRERTQITLRARKDSLLPAWSDDERYVAFAGIHGEGAGANLDLFVYDSTRGLTVRVTTGREHETVPTWAPRDG